MDKNHSHKFKKHGNYLVCECGAKRLTYKNVDGKRVGMRANGMKYTRKANINRFLFPNEYKILDDGLNTRMRYCFRFLFNTGGRIDEISKVDLDKDFIFNPKGRSHLIIRHTKTKAKKGEFEQGKPRDIPLSRQFAKYLNMHRGIKFCSKPALGIAMKKLGVNMKMQDPSDFSAHTLRKTFEVWLMAMGVNDLPLCAHLGHTPGTAASNYISPEVFSWQDKKVMRAIIGDIYEH